MDLGLCICNLIMYVLPFRDLNDLYDSPKTVLVYPYNINNEM